MVHGHFVGADEEPFTKTLQELTGRIEFKNRIERGLGAVGAPRTESATAIDGPDVAVWADSDAGGRTPFSPARELAPAEARKIRIWEVIARPRPPILGGAPVFFMRPLPGG